MNHKVIGFIVRLSATVLLGVNIAFVIDHLDTPLVVTKEVAMTNATANDVAKELLTAKSYRCLTQIIQLESNGRANAKNKTSSAKGVGQLLDSTYKNLGLKHSKDGKAQLVAMLVYIGERYGAGGPCKALRHEKRYHWY